MRSLLSSFLLGISMIYVVAPLCADDNTTAEEEGISEEGISEEGISGASDS